MTLYNELLELRRRVRHFDAVLEMLDGVDARINSADRLLGSLASDELANHLKQASIRVQVDRMTTGMLRIDCLEKIEQIKLRMRNGEK